MTTLATGLPADLAGWPSWAPDESQLADLELLLCGAFKPLGGFMSAADAAAAARHGSLADGTPFPFPVTLEVPADAVPPDAGMLVLQDPEGAPLAVLEITERIQSRPAEPVRIAGPVRGLREPEHGPFRRLRLGPAQTRAELGLAPPQPVAGPAHNAAPHDPAPHDPAPHDPAPHDPAPHDPAPQRPVPQRPVPQRPVPQRPVLACVT